MNTLHDCNVGHTLMNADTHEQLSLLYISAGSVIEILVFLMVVGGLFNTF